MYIDIKTGEIQLFDKQIHPLDNLTRITSLFPSIQFNGDYQDITWYKLDNRLKFNNCEFRIGFVFKSDILWSISLSLTDDSINKIELNLNTFREKLTYIKEIYNLFLAKITDTATLFKKSKMQTFDWGHLSVNKPTSRWPFISISFKYEKIIEHLK